MPMVRFLVDAPGIAGQGAEVELTDDQAQAWADGYRAELVENPERQSSRRVRRGIETR